ncbi:MAG: hypothetical protein P9M14_12985 [Candidatus Alcyoniella australis]|nr:hypothetical protein [Candidatus Alcyoniella australis]
MSQEFSNASITKMLCGMPAHRMATADLSIRRAVVRLPSRGVNAESAQGISEDESFEEDEEQ